MTRDGATVLVDPVSLEMLKGAELDFVDDLMGQSFRVKNPNAVASCGCGVSFTGLAPPAFGATRRIDAALHSLSLKVAFRTPVENGESRPRPLAPKSTLG